MRRRMRIAGGFHHPPGESKHVILLPCPAHSTAACTNGDEKLTEATDKEAGIIQALVERLEKQRLPMAMALKAKVDQGELLNEADLAFLEEVFASTAQIKPLLDAHPEWQDLAAQMIGLYGEITAKALENEQAAQQDE
jgi:hypothetical protein